MGLLARIKSNSRQISDTCAGTADYFELATTNLSLYRALRRAARESIRGRLLDAGAGRVAYRAMLQEFCSSYEGLDVSPLPGVDHVADLQKAGLPDAQYDSIFCTQVLQNLTEPEQAIREMARMLKPGGRVVISVPHLVWLHNEPHDYWRFTGHGMRRLVEKAGMRVIEIEPVGGLICFLAYGPSTLLLAALWPVRPLFRLALFLNRAFVRMALFADRLLGARSLYPTNFVVVAEKL